MATEQGGIDADTPRLREKWFKQMLNVFEPGRLIDLGSGHGQFAMWAADMGWKVTALDARGDRYPKPRDPRVEWKVGDVRDADLSEYDVIACLGLFYHLTAEDQLSLLKQAAGTPMILDTHVANGQPCPWPLSEEVEHSGFRGQLFTEAEQSKHSTASWGNDLSFWARPDELYRMFAEHGYNMLEAQPWYMPTRTYWLCMPDKPVKTTARKAAKRPLWRRVGGRVKRLVRR